jgi:DNA-binding MarR family transcriptional regulator/GNAT superfamily N-acetyltransferase
MTADTSDQVAFVRHFNRLYTHAAGLLTIHKDCHLPLAEARVLFEIGQSTTQDAFGDGIQADGTTATALCMRLGLDDGYMSRILRKLQANEWIEKRPSMADNRVMVVRLTPKGVLQSQSLIQKADDLAWQQLKRLDEHQRQQLLCSMQTIEILSKLPDAIKTGEPVTFRHPQAGDLGWVVEKHGELYAKEHGWNLYFEGLCAEIVADFAKQHDPSTERCWIAVKEGQRIGCVFVVKGSDVYTAKLRLLLLTPEARGIGLGRRLMEECLAFARQAGYGRMELWTNNTLLTARQMYKQFGFQITATEPNTNFGPPLVSETWTKILV